MEIMDYADILVENGLDILIESADQSAAKRIFKKVLNSHPKVKKDYTFNYNCDGSAFVEQTKKTKTWSDKDMDIISDFHKDIINELKKSNMVLDADGVRFFVAYYVN